MTFSLDGAYFSPSQGSTTGPGLVEGSNQRNPSFPRFTDFDAQRLIEIAAQHPYTCGWMIHRGAHCGMPIFAHKFPAHLREYHGISGMGRNPIYCKWEGCGALVSKESINQHVTEMHLHRSHVTHVCTICGEEFFRKYTLNSHIRTRHPERGVRV